MKQKGTRAERELVKMFWDAGWSAIRAAGSGSMPLPSPDVLAGNGKRYVAVECKAIGSERHYFSKKELDQLRQFAAIFGAEPWIGMRFDKTEWLFIPLSTVVKGRGSHFVITRDFAISIGLSFERLSSMKPSTSRV